MHASTGTVRYSLGVLSSFFFDCTWALSPSVTDFKSSDLVDDDACLSDGVSSLSSTPLSSRLEPEIRPRRSTRAESSGTASDSRRLGGSVSTWPNREQVSEHHREQCYFRRWLVKLRLHLVFDWFDRDQSRSIAIDLEYIVHALHNMSTRA